MDRKSWVQALPKAEYHLHLEGSVPWQLVRNAQDEPLSEKPFWAAENYRYKDFDEFQQALSGSIKRVMVSLEDYQRIAQLHLRHLQEENCVYVEASVSLGGLIRRGIKVDELLKALQTIVPDGMTLAMIIGFGRKDNFSDEILADVLNSPHLAGIDLIGDERLGNLDRYIEVYQEARRLGLRTKAHSGELGDAAAIRETIEKLQPERIQHGITAAKDQNLLKQLADEGISLDICPSSNLMLGVVSDLATYPIRAFLDAGVDISLNTDDPAMFNCTINSEFHAMLEHNLISLSELAAMQRRALSKARMSQTAIEAAQAKIAEHLNHLEA